MAPVDPQKIKAAYAAALKLQEAGKDDDALKAFGQIVEATDKAPTPDVEMAGANGMNDFGTGTIQTVTAENAGGAE